MNWIVSQWQLNIDFLFCCNKWQKLYFVFLFLSLYATVGAVSADGDQSEINLGISAKKRRDKLFVWKQQQQKNLQSRMERDDVVLLC